MNNRTIGYLLTLVMLLSVAPLASSDEENSTGSVAETIDVGSYIYVRIAETGAWVAAAPITVKTGDRVTYSGGALMKDFYSPKLDRTFEEIWFVMNLSVSNQDDPHTRSLAKQTNSALPEGHAAVPLAVAPSSGSLPSLKGGMTIEQVLAGYPHAGSQKVSLRAKIMKVSEGIMGKNWITLQDGTGKPPGDALIATSKDVPEPGQIVVVTATIANDVSLGYGYDYKVLLEDAVFAPENGTN